jgi:hypothetical protein
VLRKAKLWSSHDWISSRGADEPESNFSPIAFAQSSALTEGACWTTSDRDGRMVPQGPNKRIAGRTRS